MYSDESDRDHPACRLSPLQSAMLVAARLLRSYCGQAHDRLQPLMTDYDVIQTVCAR